MVTTRIASNRGERREKRWWTAGGSKSGRPRCESARGGSNLTFSRGLSLPAGTRRECQRLALGLTARFCVDAEERLRGFPVALPLDRRDGCATVDHEPRRASAPRRPVKRQAALLPSVLQSRLSAGW